MRLQWAVPIVSSPLPAYSEASFGKQATEKKTAFVPQACNRK
jgi:hypothetical protein